MQSRFFASRVTLVAAFCGLAVALFLVYEHNRPDFSAFCGSNSCGSALHSRYGQVGSVPTAAFGAGMYLLLIALCLKRQRRLRSSAGKAENASDSELALRSLDRAVWGLTALGFGVSLWLQYVALYVLAQFCIYCFASACCITVAFLAASWSRAPQGRAFSPRFAVACVAALLFLGGIGAKAWPHIQDEWPRSHPAKITSAADPHWQSRVLGDMAHVKGDPNARFQLVMFGDYACPACHRTVPRVEALLRRHRPLVRLVFRNAPMEAPHPWAFSAACAAEAAGAQGKFWQMHDLLYVHQEELDQPNFSPEKLVAYAKRIGLNADAFRREMEHGNARARVKADLADFHRCDLETVPVFFLVTATSAERYEGEEGLQELGRFLDREASRSIASRASSPQ